MTNKALTGIKVVDFSENLPGPYTSLWLASLGAEVIKVERPGGDPASRLDKLYQMLNHSKSVCSFDLSNGNDIDKVKDLILSADVVLESFRPGTLKSLGVDFEALGEQNPKIIFCSISGYGQKGPWARRPAHDLNLQAMSGFSHLERKNKKAPGRTVLPIADLSASMLAVVRILGALLQRERTGKGQFIDVAMVDLLYHWVQLWSQGTDPSQWLDGDKQPGKLKQLMHGSLERLRLYVLPHYDFFSSKDGQLALGIVMEQKFWRLLTEELDRPFMKAFSLPMRVMSRQLVRQALGRRFQHHRSSHWLEALADVLPLSPVLTPQEAQDHEAMSQRPGVGIHSPGVPLDSDSGAEGRLL